MESITKILEFLGSGCGDGDGDGSGYGDGSGFGSGYGYGSGFGSGSGSGDGDGDGWGCGDGSGSGSGDGDGDGWGCGDGSGYGDGYGYGYGWASIKYFCGSPVFVVDGLPTIITIIHGNVAKGMIVKADLTTEPCYVIKQADKFAHGRTLRKAMAALADKLFDGMSVDERIAAFLQSHTLGVPYSNRDLYEWHHRLTGSCDMGRRTFAEEHGIDVEHGAMTVEEFIGLTWDAYGAEIIHALGAACGYQPPRHIGGRDK